MDVPTGAAAIVLEPLIQGVNEMRPWPAGQLAEIRSWCDGHGVHLILDEVMTGFGRTGTMFACQQEEVIPDFLCLAKGLTGGYLPLAATLTTGRVFDAFLGGRERTLNYGHRYTAKQRGGAAAPARLSAFEEDRVLRQADVESGARVPRQAVSQLDLADYYWARMSLNRAMTLYVTVGEVTEAALVD